MESVRRKSRVDRISALPDILIQHILSFLPSTKEAIRTSTLSKRWKDQWAYVPVLILKSSGMSYESFFRYTERVLLAYEPFKIRKFHIQYDNGLRQDPHFASKVRFATRRNVEELILNCNFPFEGRYVLPEFVYKHASLVKLHTHGCTFIPKNVNWECLQKLVLSFCSLSNLAIRSVLSGSPLLQWLELRSCNGFDKLVIFSNFLKSFVLVSYLNIAALQISCPNLLEIAVLGSSRHFTLSSQAIEKVLSRSPLLKSLELHKCDGFEHLVIASKSLRQLVLEELRGSVIEISCPNLKELKLEDLKDVGTIKLKN